MTLSTSAVAAFCSRACLSSRVSRTTPVSRPDVEELPPRAAFRVFGLRLRALTDLLLALERRRIAHPKLKTTPIFKVGLQQGLATGEMGFRGRFVPPQS